jgi:hypothetical protein
MIKGNCMVNYINNYTIIIKSKYNSQYTAGGIEGLIDGINGNENWRKENGTIKIKILKP